MTQPAPPGHPVVTHWEELAAQYDGAFLGDPVMASLHQKIIERIPTGSRAILDLGAGTGTLLLRIRRLFPRARVLGLDPAWSMVEQARAKLAKDDADVFRLGRAEDIDLPNASFDVIVTCFALHHLSEADKTRAAYEMYRVLTPGGTLVFGDQHAPSLGSPADPRWLAEMLQLFSRKALYYLRHSGPERMIVQARMLPKLLTADGEIVTTPGFWTGLLARAGFSVEDVVPVPPEWMLHRVIVARKPPARHQRPGPR